MPPGPSMSAPQVRVFGESASAIFFNSSVRPKKEGNRGRLLGVLIAWLAGAADGRERGCFVVSTPFNFGAAE